MKLLHLSMLRDIFGSLSCERAFFIVQRGVLKGNKASYLLHDCTGEKNMAIFLKNLDLPHSKNNP